MGRTPETGLTPAEWREFPRYALVRILMHAVKQSLRVSGGLSGGLLPVLPVSRQKRPEGLSGGADNGCYGKCENISFDKKLSRKIIQQPQNFDGPELCT